MMNDLGAIFFFFFLGVRGYLPGALVIFFG